MHIVLCRHGETEWSLSGQHTSSTDIPLTKKGEAQAKELRSKLESLTFDKVYTSPLQRAKKTCQLAHLTQPMILEPLAVEWNYGDYEGKTTSEIWENQPHWNLFFDGAPNGESPDQVARRADKLIEKWLTEKIDILLFSHGHFLRVLATRWLELEPADARLFGLSVASVSVLGFERSQRIIQTWNR